MSDDNDKSHRGAASQFFVAGELCRRGVVAVVTLGNCPNTDILCSNLEGTRFVHVQVKTFRPGGRTCSVGMKAERDFGENFFWVLSGIPEPDSTEQFTYYIIPASEMAKHVSTCFRLWVDAPGKDGQAHDKDNTIRTVFLPPRKNRDGWDIAAYQGRWDLITGRLKGATPIR